MAEFFDYVVDQLQLLFHGLNMTATAALRLAIIALGLLAVFYFIRGCFQNPKVFARNIAGVAVFLLTVSGGMYFVVVAVDDPSSLAFGIAWLVSVILGVRLGFWVSGNFSEGADESSEDSM